MKQITKNQLILSLLILLFVGPMVAAWLCYAKSDLLHPSPTNAGQLLQKPKDFSQLKLFKMDGSPWMPTPLQHHWILLYLAPIAITDQDEKNIYYMRQVRIALGKDRNRVERLIVTYPEQATPKLEELLSKDYSGTYHAMSNAKQVRIFFGDSLPEPIALHQGNLYLVDPLGNIMMKYGPEIIPKKLLSDLTRLLKTSQIG